MEGGVSQGPLINGAGRSKVARHVASALEMGATLETGGGEVPAQGANFFTPTVLTGVTNDMAPFREETFGPVCPIAKFKTEDEAIALANDAEVGLAGYFCSRDLGRVWRVAEALEVGMVGINEGIISSER